MSHIQVHVAITKDDDITVGKLFDGRPTIRIGSLSLLFRDDRAEQNMRDAVERLGVQRTLSLIDEVTA